MNYDFGSADPWGLGGDGTMLELGDQVVEIHEQEGKPFFGESRGGDPMISLLAVNGDKNLRDWVVILPQTIGKVKALLEGAGVTIPAQVTAEDLPGLCSQLKGKKVGCRVALVPDNRPDAAPGATQRKITGYCHPGEIVDGVGPTPQPVAAGATPKDDDIPF